jgi:phage shock protein PspC (stress-responsive transcriptional regulator)
MTQTTSPAPTPSSAFWQRFRDLGSLRRPSDHRAIAGVAEGLSRHFDIDPIIVRVLFAALTFFGGAGLILYIALWLTVPLDVTGESLISSRLHRDAQAWTTIGLATGGIFATAALLGSLSWAIPHPFPFLLIALVVVLGLVALTRRADRVPPMPAPYTPPVPPPSSTETSPASPSAPTIPSETEPTTQMSTTETSTTETPTMKESPETSTALIPTTWTTVDPYVAPDPPTNVAREASADSTTELQAPLDTRAWWQRDDIPPTSDPVPPFAAPPPPPRRPRSHLFGLTMALIALAEAVVWIIDATSSYDVNPSVYPGTALAVIAVALLAGTWWGRSRGLIAMGVLASLITAAAAFAGPGPYGDKSAIPHQASDLQSSYRMGIGRFTLNLEQVTDIQALQGRDVTINQRFGQLRVVIPSSVAAVVDATVDHGSIDGPPDVETLDQGGERVAMNPNPDGRPTITLHLHVAYGDIRIERALCRDAAPAAAGETTYIWQEGNSYVAAACN